MECKDANESGMSDCGGMARSVPEESGAQSVTARSSSTRCLGSAFSCRANLPELLRIFKRNFELVVGCRYWELVYPRSSELDPSIGRLHRVFRQTRATGMGWPGYLHRRTRGRGRNDWAIVELSRATPRRGTPTSPTSFHA